MIRTIVVIAKQPVPGRVKTRLIGACTPAEAADLASHAVFDTLAALANFPCEEKVILLDGNPNGWLPDGWRVIEQVDGDLDERLSAGFDALNPGPAVLVGMDTPQLHAGLLGFNPVTYDSCLGPASDGGYWAIGFADPALARGCIRGVAMSRSDTGAEQHRRLRAAGMSVQELPELIDVDTADTAHEVARLAPHTAFARRWRELGVAL